MHLVAIRVSCLRHQSTLIIRHSGQDRDEDVAGLSTATGMDIKGHGNISCLSEKWLSAGPRTKGSGCAREWLRRFRERPRRPKRTGAEEPPDIVGSRDSACLPFEFGDGDGDGDGEGKEFTDLDFPLPDNGTSQDNGRFHITTGRIELYCFCYLCKLGRGKQQHKCS
ncbi:hypothetical protein FOC1_g10008493 [Fusarium oxysporum f. sp. cubense race 1]|uniref:Uncharacterized protein n=1 Tax=Fusarium oxysporum f. sp. cubense (strain race 1) TaxID=1229664 RepID=N4UQP2_FUSC1|nr:hypothetical protein FOC1_g10008493 [Fusarium oxysporum f. sp. cubense race 1]